MIPNSFDYKKANSVEEALALKREGSSFLAGGHSIVPAMKLRLNQVETLVDISKISSLRFIREEEHSILVGAATTHAEIADSELIRSHLPMISDGANMIGDIQVRNMGTIGGSIAHADPAADWPALLLASNARVQVQNVDGNREIPSGEFFTGFFETALHESDIITAVRIPKPGMGNRSAYLKFSQPASRFAIVGCAVSVQLSNGVCEKARVAFNGVSDSAFRDSEVENTLTGKTFNESTIQEASAQAGENIFILSDSFASEEYRKHLTKVFTKRTLMACL